MLDSAESAAEKRGTRSICRRKTDLLSNTERKRSDLSMQTPDHDASHQHPQKQPLAPAEEHSHESETHPHESDHIHQHGHARGLLGWGVKVLPFLHHGSFETVLADEDIKQNADRWYSHTPCAQEFSQILAQWIWNLRLKLRHLADACLPPDQETRLRGKSRSTMTTSRHTPSSFPCFS
jgi:hypothetical protein